MTLLNCRTILIQDGTNNVFDHTITLSLCAKGSDGTRRSLSETVGTLICLRLLACFIFKEPRKILHRGNETHH